MEEKISEIGAIVDNIVKKGLDDKLDEETNETSSNCKVDKPFENKDEDTKFHDKELEEESEDEHVSADSKLTPLISQKIKSSCKHHDTEDWRDGFDPSKTYKKSSFFFNIKLLGDLEISLLKARLEETEKAMERIVAQMGVVTSRLAPHIIAQAFEGVDNEQEKI